MIKNAEVLKRFPFKLAFFSVYQGHQLINSAKTIRKNTQFDTRIIADSVVKIISWHGPNHFLLSPGGDKKSRSIIHSSIKCFVLSIKHHNLVNQRRKKLSSNLHPIALRAIGRPRRILPLITSQ